MTRHETVPLGTVVPATPLERIEAEVERRLAEVYRDSIIVRDLIEKYKVLGGEDRLYWALNHELRGLRFALDAIRRERG